MIVVDTNIITYLLLEGEYTSQAESLPLKDSHLAAPILWRSEFRNVLAHYLRKEILTLEEAQEIMNEAINLMSGHEYEVASFQALDLVSSCDCSAYDCEFVTLAQDLKTILITVDKKILTEFPSTALHLVDFIS